MSHKIWENLLCYTHPLPPIPLIPAISTYTVSICYHRGLLNYCYESRNFTSLENTQIMMIFTVLISFRYQFAKNDTYLIVFMLHFFRLPKGGNEKWIKFPSQSE